MNCPNCKHEVSPEWKTCPYCEYKPQRCSQTNCTSGWLPKEAHFCPVCGAPVAGEESLNIKSKIEDAHRPLNGIRQAGDGSIGDGREHSSDKKNEGAFSINGVSFNMIKVEGGNTGTFHIGETQVTQTLWQAVMDINPSRFKGPDRPVEQVSWRDCKQFIDKLNELLKNELPDGNKFRLPTEAEWDYAAKGGSKSRGCKWSGCNSENELDQYAWYSKNALYCGLSSCDYGTHPVKQKHPNELGIYDMSGNVWEWCKDLDRKRGFLYVCRGGSWKKDAEHCRVSGRSYFMHFIVGPSGFRLAL